MSYRERTRGVAAAMVEMSLPVLLLPVPGAEPDPGSKEGDRDKEGGTEVSKAARGPMDAFLMLLPDVEGVRVALVVLAAPSGMAAAPSYFGGDATS